MSGWIKWEKDIETDPRFVRIVRKLKTVTHPSRTRHAQALQESAVITLTMGALLRFWSYADTHIRSDDTLDLGPADIDDLVGVQGFASALPEDWMRPIDDAHVELPGYQTHNGVEAKKRDLAQKRQERKRSRDSHADVTQEGDASVIVALPDQDQDHQEKNPTASATPARKRVPRETAPDPEWFLDFKLAYPERHGDQGWRKALRAANARMAEGHTPQEFIGGAQRYAAFCAATGKTGTEFVKQAATFLGPDKAFLLPWEIPASAMPKERPSIVV